MNNAKQQEDGSVASDVNQVSDEQLRHRYGYCVHRCQGDEADRSLLLGRRVSDVGVRRSQETQLRPANSFKKASDQHYERVSLQTYCQQEERHLDCSSQRR